MQAKLLIKDEKTDEWHTVATQQYEPGNVNSLADAVEALLKNKDDWIAAGFFPANAVWHTSVHGEVPRGRLDKGPQKTHAV